MSNDPPDRTIIRPNPGGRRPQQPATPPAGAPQVPQAPHPVPPSAAPPSWPAGPPQSQPGWPPGNAQAAPPQWGAPQNAPPAWGTPQTPPAGWGTPPQPQQPSWPAPAPSQHAAPQSPGGFPGQGVGTGEEWIASPAPQAPAPGNARRALARIDELFAPNANPIMRAAGPLLLLLGRLRAAILHARFASLMDQVAQSIQKFERDLYDAGVPDDQAKMAKYIVCATSDDIVQNIPADDRHEWSRYSMLSSFFGERVGGVRFFDLVERAKVDPVVNYNVLELEHACLALGFQGRYRSEGGGFATLQQVQRNLYETLRRVRPRTARDLSPNWKGQALSARRSRLRVPTWVAASVAAVLLFGLFVTLRYLLSGGAEAAAGDTLALNPHTPISIFRKAPAPPPPPPPPTAKQLTQLQRIRAALAPEISAGTISVPDPTGPYWIVINVGDALLFNSGQATLIPKFTPLANRIRAMLEKEFGTIGIVGHTDSTPLSPASPFKSNFDLSIARAKNVADVLKVGFSRANAFKIDGKGPDEPIADNKTEPGRRMNRRVEILVQRTD